MSIPRDPRRARLRTERERLANLNHESDHVRVEPIDVRAGSEPERYRVTFRCTGIVGIGSANKPILGEEHVVEIDCGESFPAYLPHLRWVTPIWHPNINHKEPKNVCVNQVQWLGMTGLDDLCRQMFEMVQYKNYHAENIEPYPLDVEVARWVLEHAEPEGIVDKRRNIFVDDKPFVRPTAAYRPTPPPENRPVRQVKILDPSPAAPAPASPRPDGVRILPSHSSQGNAASSARPVRIVKKG